VRDLIALLVALSPFALSAYLLATGPIDIIVLPLLALCIIGVNVGMYIGGDDITPRK